MARSAYLEVPDQSSPFDYYADAWRDACPGKLPPGISIGGRLVSDASGKPLYLPLVGEPE